MYPNKAVPQQRTRARNACQSPATLGKRCLSQVSPSKRNRKVAIPHYQTRYRTSHRIENLFGFVKDYTRIILRKDKISCSYAGFISLAFTLINI